MTEHILDPHALQKRVRQLEEENAFLRHWIDTLQRYMNNYPVPPPAIILQVTSEELEKAKTLLGAKPKI